MRKPQTWIVGLAAVAGICVLTSCASSEDRSIPTTDASTNDVFDAVVDAGAPVCGDTHIGGQEECDDGNLLPGDGCDLDCKIEPGWSCNGEPSVCSNLCGNGTVDPGEDCDGTDLGGQTCASLNQGFESGTLKCSASCRFDTTECTSPGCGNGTVDSGEECDDGNQSNEDGCLNNCRSAECGDGYTYLGHEECDDGNLSNRDACLTNCRNATCGDGFIRDGVEGCDDGDNDNGDGCSSTCSVETGWSCEGMPSQCEFLCGNNRVDNGEECDDGNTVAGDGCSPDCRDEHLPVLYWGTGNPATWGHMTITYAGDPHAPSEPIVAAVNADQRDYAYVFTATTYHLLSLPDHQWIGHGLLSARFPAVPGSLIKGAFGISWESASSTSIYLTVPSRNQAYLYHEDNLTGDVTADASNPIDVDWASDPNAPEYGESGPMFQTLDNANGWTHADLHSPELCGDNAPAGADVGPYVGVLCNDGRFYLYNSSHCWMFYDNMPVSQFPPFTVAGAPPTTNVLAMFYSTEHGNRLYVIVSP